MAKSIRSKSRQRTLSIRRKKFRERERLKAWDHYRKIKSSKETKMEEDTTPDEDSTNMMDIQEPAKISKKEITKWASRNSKKRQKKVMKARSRRKQNSQKQKRIV